MADLAAARDLMSFIDASPSPFHACANAAARLEATGFGALDETDPWPPDARRNYFVRDGSLVAWRTPASAGPTTGFRIVGAHTDSPNLRVTPHPDVSRAGVDLIDVEVYGGTLFNSWLDRDLGLSGRVGLRNREVRLVLVDRPIARIPQLAIHLDREVNAGLTLNPQQHLNPLWAIGGADFGAFVAAELGVEAPELAFWDLMFHDVTPSALIGRNDEFVSASRLDNLCSSWAAIDALISADDPTSIAVVALFDHEEIGSSSNRGAASPVLESTLERITLSLGGGRDEWRRALAASSCLSADMAHATHPNYSERHEPNHWIALNGGPVVKTNVSQRYATDARSAPDFIAACDDAGVPVQHYVHRNDMVCGSTIGPITAARLGIATLDVGAPQLAMHSARELMGSADVAWYRDAMRAFFARG
ncbi:MAG TPA: M18 family aminopeptidase [Acidimicrobiales bacterium]|jgi:aspartyl aminopeptidase|nr:M18 family aminopeptidase [Acidimicrobiales bacterium]